MANPIHSLKRKLARAVSADKPLVQSAPSAQNALDIFAGEWASSLPEPYANLRAGGVPLFQDSRIEWAAEQLNVKGKSILELGPLEGGHTYMLEKMGAESIVAIEANAKAFLKCLIIKEILGLKHAQFLCGDFLKYLETKPPRFDAVIASGVLYHMAEPVALIEKISNVADAVYIWTQYYDDERIKRLPARKRNFAAHEKAEHRGFAHTQHRHEYIASFSLSSFYGGNQGHSHWLSKDDILGALKHFGFKRIEIQFDQPEAENGPAISLLASKDKS
jgi:hypothetical protein